MAAAKEPRGRKAAPARRPAPVVVPEAVEGEKAGGLDLDSGLVLATAFLLVVGIALLWIELAKHYDAGPFG